MHRAGRREADVYPWGRRNEAGVGVRGEPGRRRVKLSSPTRSSERNGRRNRQPGRVRARKPCSSSTASAAHSNGTVPDGQFGTARAARGVCASRGFSPFVTLARDGRLYSITVSLLDDTLGTYGTRPAGRGGAALGTLTSSKQIRMGRNIRRVRARPGFQHVNPIPDGRSAGPTSSRPVDPAAAGRSLLAQPAGTFVYFLTRVPRLGLLSARVIRLNHL